MNRKGFLLMLLLFGSAATPVLAQTEAPQQPAPLRFILDLQGKWESTASMQLEDNTYSFQYFADFRPTADGDAVLMLESADISGVGKLRGANLIGFNPYDGKIHWYSVDNMGTTHEHIGDLSSENEFRMIHSSMQNGKSYQEDIGMKRINKNELVLKVVATLDGKIVETINGTFKRSGSPRE